MNAHLTLNIVDVDRAVREMLQREVPALEVEGYTVMSWNTPLFEIVGDMVTVPVRHNMNLMHATLKK